MPTDSQHHNSVPPPHHPPPAEQPPTSAARLAELLDSAPIVLVCFLPFGDFRPTSFSANVRDLVGYDASYLLANPGLWLTLVHPDDQPLLDPHLKQLLAEGRSRSEYRVRRRDGVYRWIRSELRLSYDESARLGEASGWLQDITEERETMAALLSSDARFRAAMEGSLDAVMLLECERASDGTIRDLRFVELNRQAEEMLDYARGGLLGRGICELFPVNIESGFFDQYVRVVETREPLLQQFRLPRGDEERWYEHQVVPLGDGVAITMRNITGRRRMEAALQASERKARALLDAPSDYILLLDREGRILDMNRATLEVSGLTFESAIGQDAFAILFPRRDLAERERLRFFDAVATAEERRFDADLDGRSYEVQMRPVLDDEGRVLQAAVFVRDVTERRRDEEARLAVERKLQETQRLESLGVLAGGIAHDFNNLLTVILGYAQLASDDLPPGSLARDSLDSLVKGATRAAELTNQLLAYAGKGRFVIEPVNVNRLIREMNDLLQVSIAHRSAVFCELAEPLPFVEADAAQLRQVLLNLLTNAAESLGEDGGAITLTTGARWCSREDLDRMHVGAGLPPGHYVSLTVEDTGSGMDEATLARIFDPFFSTKFTGRGLGLAAVQGIIRSHRGALEVTSTPGRGTLFRVWLPALDAAPAETAPPAETRAALAGTILVVDDEPDVRNVTVRMLQRLGFETIVCGGGQEALGMLRGGIDGLAAVLTDLTMPQMTGDALARQIVRLRPGLPVILMSGYHAEVAAEQFADVGLAGFVQKPFTLGMLRAVLERAIRRARRVPDVDERNDP